MDQCTDRKVQVLFVYDQADSAAAAETLINER